MKQSLTEADLLALIEGHLPPDRVEVVRAALTSDPVLLRRVEAMVRDRERLRREGTAPLPAAALNGLVAQSIAEAERDALLGSQAPRVTGRPARRASHPSASTRSRRIAMLVAAGLGLSVLGTWSYFLLRNAGPSGFRRESSMEFSKIPQGDVFSVATPEGTPEFVGPPASLGEALWSTPDTVLASDAGPDTPQPEHLEQLLTPGITLDDAVRLARDGRLRLRLVSAGSDELARSMSYIAGLGNANLRFEGFGADPAEPRASNDSGPAASGHGPRISVTDTGDDAVLRSQLLLAIERLGIVTGSHVEFAEAPASPSTMAQVRPLLTAARLLWWGEAERMWQPDQVLAIPIQPAD